MERLTERFSNGQAAVLGCGNNCKYDFKYCNNHLEDCPTINEIYERLALYEDTDLTPEQMKQIDKAYSELAKELHDWQENGIKLPCRAGDTMYVVTHPYNVTRDEDDFGKKEEIFEAKCSSVTVFKASMQYRFIAGGRRIGEFFTDSSFGKTVFLTKEEAEAKLKEMEDK